MNKKCMILCIIILLLFFLGIAISRGFNPTNVFRSAYAYCKIPEITTHENYAGVLSIPSVGIEVDCIDVAAGDTKFSQIVTDRSNCAARILIFDRVIYGESERNSRWVIGDHNYQDFNPLKDCQIGDSAFFASPNGSVQEYVVEEVTEGRNENNDLLVNGKSISQVNPDLLILYTCKDSTSIPVYVVILQPI